MAAAQAQNGVHNSIELASSGSVEEPSTSFDNAVADLEKSGHGDSTEFGLDQSTAIEHSDGSDKSSEDNNRVPFKTLIAKCFTCPKRHPWWCGCVVFSMLVAIITYISIRAHARSLVEPGGEPGDYCLVDNTCSYGKCDRKEQKCMCSRNDYYNEGGGCGYENSMCSLSGLSCVEKPPCPSNITLGIHRSGLLQVSPNKEDVPNFGHQIVMDGDTSAIVGQPRCLTSKDNRHHGGSAHVFRKVSEGGRERWILEATLKPGTTRERGGFGVGVTLDGDWAMVGATSCNPRESGIPGKVYVFKRDRSTGVWTMVQDLRARTDADYKGDAFGWSVALCKDTAVIGDPEGNAVYFFKLNKEENIWEREGGFRSNAGIDRFGLSVDICKTNDRESFVVGAPKGNNGVGAAYVYSRDRKKGESWGDPLVLPAAANLPNLPLPPEGSVFGSSVAIKQSRDEDRTLLVAVGAFKDTSNDFNQESLAGEFGNETLSEPDRSEASGSAYVFGLNSNDLTPKYAQKLTAQDDPIAGMYGAATAKHFRDDHMFSKNFQWIMNSRSRWFGSSVDISVDDSRGERIVVGAVPRDGDEALAHVFALSSRGKSWYEETRFRREGQAPTPTPDSMSRTYVAINGGTVLMGTPNDAMVYAPDPLSMCGKFVNFNHEQHRFLSE